MTQTMTTYAQPWIGAGYDALARAVFAAVGGLDALRTAALDALALQTGSRVLELGCGTGGFTRAMIARGAVVTSVDRSAPMLRRARRRAPAAMYHHADITTFEPGAIFDRVLLAFVLHELEPADRHRVLRRARAALAPGGRVLIVEHALPERGVIPRSISRLVHAFEPSTIVAWLRSGFDPEVAAAGLTIAARRDLARGTAVVLTCCQSSPEHACSSVSSRP